MTAQRFTFIFSVILTALTSRNNRAMWHNIVSDIRDTGIRGVTIHEINEVILKLETNKVLTRTANPYVDEYELVIEEVIA